MSNMSLYGSNYYERYKCKCLQRWNFCKKNVGIFIHDQDHILLVYQNYSKKWGIPKGSTEYGESIKYATYRELYEETGLRHFDLCIMSENKFNELKYEITDVLINNKMLPRVYPIDKVEIGNARWFKFNKIPSNINSITKQILNRIHK